VADPYFGDDRSRPPERPKSAQPTPKAARVPRTPEGTLGVALLVYAAVNGVSGLLIAFLPRLFWDTIGGASGDLGRALDSTRFAGGALIALAIGALLVLRRPDGQHTLVTVFALEATFVAAGLATNVLVDDTVTHVAFDWVMLLGCAAVAGYLWWARVKARKILKPRPPSRPSGRP
jgi:hypothetical protein